MTFMLAVLLSMAIPMIYFFKGFHKLAQGEGAPAISPYVMVAMLGGMLIAMGFGLGLLTAGTPWRPGHDTNYSPLLFLVGGLVVCIASGISAFRGSKAPYGSWIVAALAGLHLVYSGADHMAFYWDKQKVGMMASDLAAKGDVKCAAAYVIIKQEGNVFRYRCPTVLRLGNELGEPFVPWPAYQEGISDKLPKVIKDLEAQVDRDNAEQRKASVQDEKK